MKFGLMYEIQIPEPHYPGIEQERYNQVLDQVDTNDVPPTGHSVTLENVMRDDETIAPMPKEDTLANAPLSEDDFFRVKAVLD